MTRGADCPDSYDHDLIRRIARREPEALTLLYDRFAPRLLGLLARITGHRGDAEDLLQDTFLQVWRKAADYDPDRSSPITWLFLIARSRALDFRRGRRRIVVGGELETPILHESFGDLERDESARRLHELMERLPGPQRTALTLAYFEGLSHAEIAAMEGISLGTAKTRIRLGMQRLRELLGETKRGVG